MARPKRQRLPQRPADRGKSQLPGERSPLRVAVTRGGLALELDAPVQLGLLEIEQVEIRLVGVSFPVDLSAGVARFRHRRGALERVVVRAGRERLIQGIAPRLRGLLGAATPAVALLPVPGGIGVGISLDGRALAFDLLWAPRDGDARFVVCQARGLALPGPALAAALHATDAVFGWAARRSGAFVTIPNAGAAMGRQVLPAVGARAPSARDLRWGTLDADPSGWRVTCDVALAPPMLADWVIREIELASLTEEADEKLSRGDGEGARTAYLDLLERAPRDPEVARRIADLDRATGGRTEAALSTLRESLPLREAGFLGAELLESTGSISEARSLYETAADHEPHGLLAAHALLAAARLQEAAGADEPRRDSLLDKAVARAPSLAAPRWTRLIARIDRADIAGALADAEHLEAAARGARARHEVWRRVGETLLETGRAVEAVNAFERSLRYTPDSPAAVAGLAQSLYRAGRKGRALDLSARAIALAAARREPMYAVVLQHARALAEWARDLPHAIAHLQSIPEDAPEATEARFVEARYRAELGDAAGASLAFAAMRTLIERERAACEPIDTARANAEPRAKLRLPRLSRRAAVWLREAGRFEYEVQHDLQSAQQHLSRALELAPRDEASLALFREVGAKLRAASASFPSPQPTATKPRAEKRATQERTKDATAHPEDATAPSEDDEARAVKLADRLRAEPDNHAVVIELSSVLERLGRDLELFALLSARIEDADGRAKADLVPRQRSVLARLAEAANREGRAGEAALYRDALVALDGAK